MQLLGHSSPDGIKKTLYPDLTNVTSAKEIIKQVIVEVK
jgi:hypothetical protein